MNQEVKILIFSLIVLVVVGFLLGILIGYFAKLFQIEEDHRIEEVTKLLPGFNCGACGFPGCSGLAGAIVTKGMSPKLCKPGTIKNFESIRDFLEETPGPDGTVIKIKL